MASPVGPKCTHTTRTTREGRKLTYQLQVIQQPERARACGSGAKSSADRRPVDPPPVVELRIFEGESMADVTFSHNANFFLYATLEAARPMASGRVQQSQASFPVLTGFPVSSMAYLDRPTPAGYFIFPDLSVRHEGKYKLAFNLYEEVKESKDADVEVATNHAEPKTPQPLAPKEHYHWRLEVQSLPFTVFSAKKFPGLAESTALSRIVAEQGCRVRIRRDVRMRRRENKSGQDFEEFDEERPYQNKESPADNYHQTSMPNTVEQGARQTSVSTSHSHHSGPYEADRRTSLHEQNYYPHQPYQQGYQGPAPTSGAATTQIGYGVPTSQHFSAQYPIATSPTQHAPTYSEGQYAYSAHASPPPHSYADRQPMANGHGRVESVDHKVHEWRQTQQYQAPYQPKPVSYSYPQSYPSTYMNNPTPGTPTPDEVSNALPPLKMPLPMEPNVDGTNAPSSRHHSLPSPTLEMDLSRPSQSAYASDIAKTLKRSFASVFETTHYDQSLSNGCRPSEAHHGADLSSADQDEDDYDDAYSMSRLKLQYKRADGTEISRRLTAVI